MQQATLFGLSIALLAAAPAGKPAPAARKPTIALRAAPRVAVAPARIVFTVELTGGDDSEDLHCLTLEWAWGDGTKSSSEGDCAPFDAEKTEVQRVFQADHEYRAKGQPSAEVKVVKGKRVVGRDSVSLTIGAPKGPTRFEYRE